MLMRRLGVAVVLVLSVSPFVQAQVTMERAFPNLSFSRPVDVQHAGDSSNRLFIVEQSGVIRVFPNNRSVSVAQMDVFLDIRSQVRRQGNEEGLLGLAFHPNYATNGFFYVYYSASNPRRSIISRFSVSSTGTNQASRVSEVVIMEIAQPFGNHNGGQISFGPDGYLYIALGDGGSAGDPEENSEDATNLLGAILRIDVDQTSGGANYAIPVDNPFVGNSNGFREEIYAFGLRNPWRFSFDAATGNLWTADVGQNRFEEINIVESGKNYGWDIMEGSACFEPATGCAQGGLTEPIWSYPQSEGRSITGGFVYRGVQVPELVGRYVYADYISGRVWALAYDGVNPTENEWVAERLSISTFGVDEGNELYAATLTGDIYRFISSSATGTEEVPDQAFALGANYPNPFQQATNIPFSLVIPAHVDIQVFDILGRSVRTLQSGYADEGSHVVMWDGRDDTGHRVPAGIYMYRLRADQRIIDTRVVSFLP